MSHSFQQAKQAPTPTCWLVAHPTTRLALATDTSDSHIGSVLQQLISNHWQPLCFFSAKLSPTQQCYSTFDRELQAACSVVLHFRSHLEGCPFLLLTDHKSLVAAFHWLYPPNTSTWQQHQLAFLSEISLTMASPNLLPMLFLGLHHLPSNPFVISFRPFRPYPPLPFSPSISPTANFLSSNTTIASVVLPSSPW